MLKHECFNCSFIASFTMKAFRLFDKNQILKCKCSVVRVHSGLQIWPSNITAQFFFGFRDMAFLLILFCFKKTRFEKHQTKHEIL